MPPTTTPSRLKLAASALAIALIAAACGGGDDSEVSAAAASDDAEVAQAVDDSAMEDDAMEEDAMEDGDDDAMEEDAMADVDLLTVTIENIGRFPVSESGVFAVPAGAAEPGPALPGDAYEFSFSAQPGQRLSFATMLVQSNDWFFAPSGGGLELFDADGTPRTGDITAELATYDAGTEADAPLGEGSDQAPRQAGPDTGADDPDDSIRRVDIDPADYVSVTLTPGDGGRFDVRIDNVSAMAIPASPLAPGVFAVHGDDWTLFDTGQPDAGNGLEGLAEDGDAGPIGDHLASQTGTATPIAPGVWVTHDESVALFELGGVDAGLGLEALAEDGDPAPLGAALEGADGVDHAGVFTTPTGADEPGPVVPGQSYSFTVPASGDRFSLATMFVQSNDWIFATPAEGLALADLDGDISDQLIVVDPGTEIDQRPGFGADQAPRQVGPDTGADDEDTTVRLVEDRSAERYLRVTVERG